MELRVFVSSTFHDLEEERRYLVKQVFPRIRQVCRERDVVFTEIDLRWGLTEEEARHGKIIRICLEEIDRCRPFFLGILGSRYGWIPQLLDAQRDPDLLRKFPWVEDAIQEGKSLVEIEFEYGGLRDPETAHSAFFYARPIQPDDSAELQNLRERIENSGLPFHEFSSTNSLGDQIYDDLLREINRQWPPRDELNMLEREQRKHQNFAAARRRAYIADLDYLARLTKAAQQGTSVVVTGPSGAGKSALLAYWSHRYRTREPHTFFIEHYTGIGAGADHYGLLRHVLLEIKQHLQLQEDVPSDPDQLVSEAPVWFSRLAGKPCVIVLDALNQLDPASHHLGWLPDHLPEGMSIIASTPLDAMRETLCARGWSNLELHQLGIPERESITVRFLSEYHKALSTDQLHRVASDPKCERPLFLRTMLEELRIVGSFSKLDQWIEHYISARDTSNLFQRVLERMEEDYGRHTVREVMALLWASRRGLSEHEINELIPISRVHLDSFVLALDYHLHRREGHLTFFHDYLREAVQARYAATPEERAALHRRIAEYMRANEPAERRAQEEPWQWQQAQAWSELRDCLTDWSVFEQLAQKEKQYELLGYWRALEGKYDMVEEYEGALNSLRPAGSNRLSERELLSLLGELCITASLYEEAERYIGKAYSLCNSSEDEATVHITRQLADVHFYRSRYDSALELYQRVHELWQNSGMPDSKLILYTLSSVGATLAKLGRYEEAKEVLSTCLERTEQSFGANYQTLLCPVLNDLASCYHRTGQLDRAIQSVRRAIQILEECYGHNDAGLVLYLSNLGFYLRHASDYEGAHEAYQHAISISTHELGVDHFLTARAKFNLAILYAFKNEYEACCTLVAEVLPIYLKRKGAGDPETLFILRFLCDAKERSPVLREIGLTFASTALELYVATPSPDRSVVATLESIVSDLTVAEPLVG